MFSRDSLIALLIVIGVIILIYYLFKNINSGPNYERTDESYDLEAKYRTEIINRLVGYIYYWLGWNESNAKVKYTPTGLGEDLLMIECNRMIIECTFYWDQEILSIKGIVDSIDEKYYEKIKDFHFVNKTLDTEKINAFIMKLKSVHMNFGALEDEDREDLIASAIREGINNYKTEDEMREDLYDIMEGLMDMMFTKQVKNNRNLNLLLTRLFMVFGKEYGEAYINYLKENLEKEQKDEK